MSTLQGKTLFITGASRGIGLAIALRAARDGANIVVVAKTDQPDPRLPGTIHTAVEEINKAGGNGLACACDIRLEEQVRASVEKAVDNIRPHRRAHQQRECNSSERHTRNADEAIRPDA